MTDWFGGSGVNAHERLREWLETSPSAEAARFAESGLDTHSSPDRVPERLPPSPSKTARVDRYSPLAFNH